MVEDISQRPAIVFRYLRPEPQLLRVCAWPWVDMGRHTVGTGGQSAQDIRYPMLCRSRPEECLVRVVS